MNVRHPDFKHKTTKSALWLDSKYKPLWVDAELAAMAPGTVQESNVVSWNTRLARHVKAGQSEKTMELFQQMQQEGITPDAFTFVQILNACANSQALDEGRLIHAWTIRSGCESNVFVRCSLVNMYAKCGRDKDAQKEFDKIWTHYVMYWSAMIPGHMDCVEGQKGLESSQQVQCEAVQPDPGIFVAVLNACASLVALEEGSCVHEHIIQSGFGSNVVVNNSLIDMYVKCGSIDDAWGVFNQMPTQDVVSWNAMILGHVKCGQGHKALALYGEMQREGVQPDPYTFVGVLSACASVEALEEGRHIHEQIIRCGCESNVFLGNSLIDMYAKCRSMEDAGRVFGMMHTRNIVAWTAMILGHVKCGEGQKALALSHQMQQEGVRPDPVNFVAVLNACASVSALEEGRYVHKQIIQSGFESNFFVGSGLIDMYSKCGSIEDAERVFNSMPKHDAVCWTAMLGGYAMHGHAKQALRHFKQMCDEGVEINNVTFVSLLSACSHAGLVDEGVHYFGSMSSVYHISPTVEHYVCMVDLLGRAGRLQEAEDLINTISCEPNAAVWMALLGACRVHGNVEMGERIAKRVLELDPQSAAGYVLLSNIYAAADKWDLSANVQQQRLERGVKKQPGCSWIEVNNEVHTFRLDNQEHPQLSEIHAELERLYRQMNHIGYVPDTKFVLHDVDEEEKVFCLSHHSEKLAIAFGLLNTPAGTPLRIFKNLQVCGDCHTATKFIAKIARREIIVRDVNRFHHFKDGLCSCRDYWQ